MGSSECAGVVLVVDDENDIREAIRGILEQEGYRVYVASNGRDALRVLREETPRPCLILLDLMMPVMDGWTLLELLEADASLAAIPVTVVSAARYQGSVRAARFIKKPLSLDLLLATVRDFCGPGASAASRGVPVS